MVKTIRIQTILYFTLLGLVVWGSCSRKDASQSDIPPKKSSAKNEFITGAQVTFVELGSVNCIPCRMMQPVMKEIEAAYAGKVKVVFIDVMSETGRPYVQQFGLQAIPTQVFLDSQGKELARHTGFFPKDSIAALLATKGIK
jgi:thioredoxin 1